MTADTDSYLRIELLGPLQVRHGERVCTRFGLQKAALLLAYLALHPQHAQTRERLVDLLWPDREIEVGRDNLSTTLASLRRDLNQLAVPPNSVLLADRQTIRLNPERITTDAAEFDGLLKQAKGVAAVADRARLTAQAIALYRGDLLDSCYEDWALRAQTVYREQFCEALIDWAQDLETEQDWEAARRAAERVVELDPLREEATRALMRVQARQGNAAGAIAAFQRFRERLADELGAEPTRELRQFLERLQLAPETSTAPLADPPEPALATTGDDSPAPEDTSGNLPQWLTSFIGRQPEMAEIERLLAGNRLLTLTGIGGCGKTRLASEVGNATRSQFPGGVWMVELAALSDPTLVLRMVAQTLQVMEQPSVPLSQTLIAALKPRRLLLILDNCEHLIGACAELAASLLRACPRLNILATSREPLAIGGERTYRVPSLSLPQSLQNITPDGLNRYGAVQLFIERVQLVKNNFAVTQQNAPVVVHICQRLDGLPLAIELAAARVRSLTVEDLNQRLDNCFSLLKGGDRTALPRQQSLRALIDWSYQLLSAPERSLLYRLAVFAGGWSLEAAEEVCVSADEEGAVSPLVPVLSPDAILDLLTSLVDKSLVIAETQGGTTRYRMLETVRQYARDRLGESGESEAIRARHQRYFLTLVETIRTKLMGAEQGQSLNIFEAEHDNLRQALNFCLEQPDGAEAGLRLGGALQRFWLARGYLSEGRERLTALLARPGAGREYLKARADALNGAGSLADEQGDFAAARACHEESLKLRRELEDRTGIAASLGNLGNLLLQQSDLNGARTLLIESLAIRRELGDLWNIALSLNNLGILDYESYDFVTARARHEESLIIRRELGDKRGVGSSLYNLGDVALQQGDIAAARALFEESLTIRRELGDKRRIAYCLKSLGAIAFHQGDASSARTLYRESLTLFLELGDKRGAAQTLQARAALALKEQDTHRAVRLWGAELALREAIGFPRTPGERNTLDEQLAQARSLLGDSNFATAYAAGRALTWKQAVTEVLQEENP